MLMAKLQPPINTFFKYLIMNYEARKETLTYYGEYCQIAGLPISPKQLLHQDMQKATSPYGVCIWTPGLDFFGWEIEIKTLWIEHAIGYLSDIRSQAESYGSEWTAKYNHRNKIRTQNMHRLLDRL